MHARTGSSQMKAGKMDEAISMYRDSILPDLKKQKGFKGLYWLTDRSTDKYTVLTLWETEADMKATETSGLLQEVLAKFGPYMATPPSIERYEISFHA
ncbi:MAG: antibiotic biosynthesis monooxygenase family protein [Anaerolineales bacterium]